MTVSTLLPPNASPLERALEQSTARIADVPVPLHELWNPETCPLDLLPWLAWALSADRWEVHWSEDQKRFAVAQAIEIQRTKGTPAAVETVLRSFDVLLKLTEWFEMNPRGIPHTFDIDLPLISENGDLGGFRSSAEFAEAIIRDVTRTKPARSHFRLIQSLAGEAEIRVIAAGRTAGYNRGDFQANITDAGQDWSRHLLTENGEPLVVEPGGAFLTHESFLPHTLDINFLTGTYHREGAAIATLAAFPGYSYTRAGAIGVLDTDGTVDFFAAHALPLNGKGFHAHGALTSYATHNRAPENWIASGMTKTANDAVAPDGTMKACRFTPPAGTSFKCIQQYGVNAHNGVVKTASIFIKKGGPRYWQISADVMPAFNFDIVALATKKMSGTGGASYIVDCGDYVRLVVVYPTSNFGGNVYITLVDSYNAATYANSSVTTPFHAWGFSLINGDFPLGGAILEAASAYGVTAGASALTFSVPNGSYLATYLLANGANSQVPVTVSGGTFTHATHPAIAFAVVERLILELA